MTLTFFLKRKSPSWPLSIFGWTLDWQDLGILVSHPGPRWEGHITKASGLFFTAAMMQWCVGVMQKWIDVSASSVSSSHTSALRTSSLLNPMGLGVSPFVTFQVFLQWRYILRSHLKECQLFPFSLVTLWMSELTMLSQLCKLEMESSAEKNIGANNLLRNTGTSKTQVCTKRTQDYRCKESRTVGTKRH